MLKKMLNMLYGDTQLLKTRSVMFRFLHILKSAKLIQICNKGSTKKAKKGTPNN